MALLTRRLKDEHRALRGELGRCLGHHGEVSGPRFERFRHHLVRHVMVEERLLVPLLRAEPRFALFRNEIHLDHHALAALCTPVPHRQWVEDLAGQLEHHHRMEERPEGFYALLDGLGVEEQFLVRRAAELPAVVLPPLGQGPAVRAGLEQLMALITGHP